MNTIDENKNRIWGPRWLWVGLGFLAVCNVINAFSGRTSVAKAEEAYLSVRRAKELKFDSETKISSFSLEGRGAREITVTLWALSKEEVQQVASKSFGGISRDFSGEIYILEQDGKPFGQEGRRGYSLSASIPNAGMSLAAL